MEKEKFLPSFDELVSKCDINKKNSNEYWKHINKFNYILICILLIPILLIGYNGIIKFESISAVIAYLSLIFLTLIVIYSPILIIEEIKKGGLKWYEIFKMFNLVNIKSFNNSLDKVTNSSLINKEKQVDYLKRKDGK